MTNAAATDPAPRSIGVLVVDDSKVLRMLLVHLLNSDPEIHVVGDVGNGEEALAFVQRQRPDVILMDIHMPRLDGFETTRRIMESHPVPIVICSATSDPRSVEITFRLMEVGAVACVEKPVAREHAEFEPLVDNLLRTVKAMAEVRVVRRWVRTPAHGTRSLKGDAARGSPRAVTAIARIGIGASTGGPPALQAILGALPAEFPVPILVVQHIAAGFLPGLADWLSRTTALQVQIGANGAMPLPGHVYLAPDDFQMGVDHRGAIALTKELPENGLRPSVSYLFRTLAQHFGSRAVGVLLTGMGIDGASELKVLRERGGVTIAQDEATSVVYGMPKEAVRLEAAARVLAPDAIARELVALVELKR